MRFTSSTYTASEFLHTSEKDFSLRVFDGTESGSGPFREHARCSEYRDVSSAPEPEHVKMQLFRSSFSTRFKKKQKKKRKNPHLEAASANHLARRTGGVIS